MSFAWPHLLWLLLLPLVWLVAEFFLRTRVSASTHPKILHAEAGTHHLALVRPAAGRRRTRPWLCLGLMLSVVALARPQWGRLEEPVFDQAREIMIAIDLSRSMLSTDVRPSRLERAKLLTQSLLEKLAGERVGLVTFSGTAFLQSPLSSDYEILREFLPALGPDFLPEGGTNYRALIDTSVAAFGSSGAADRFLIVLSDGEATDDDWKSEVGELKKKGIRVIGLGVGTEAGAMIPDGAGGFMKDERGAVVLSRLESGTLQELAQVTGGIYRDASSWIDLAGVLNSTVEAGQKGKFLEKNTVRLVERFQWPLAFGVWCLLMSFYFEFPVRPRPRALKLAPPAGAPKTAPLPAAAALLAFGLLAATTPWPVATLAAETPAAAPLAKIVGRLSGQDERNARDWAELARETVTWGHHVQSEQRTVPAGPVNDALAAVELGAAQDPKAADWTQLRGELEALLKKPDEQKQQNQPQQNQDQQDQRQQNQDQQQQGQPKPDPSSQQQKSPQDQRQSQDQNSPDHPKKSPDEKKPAQSAFGDMNEHDKLPPPSRENQKVGGVPEKKDADKKPEDPSMALPLQKLDQLRNQDSPAELFQLMENDHKPTPKKKGKDW